MASPQILLCPNCGTTNRIPADKAGTPKCGKCGSPFPKLKSPFALVLSILSADPQRPISALLLIAVLSVIAYALVPIGFVSVINHVLEPHHSTQVLRSAEISRTPGGNFYVFGYINGAPVQFVVDTGATSVVLTREAAQAAGVSLDGLSYSVNAETASGRTLAAPIMLNSVTVGGITENYVSALVTTPAVELSKSLLGMSFLNRLQSWEVHGDKLTMRGR
jgi:clan AA aspartic protease (TIGR02281 family)